MITVQGSESIAAVERYLATLEGSPPDCDLKIPTSLRDDKLGGKAALLQLILTWGRRHRGSRLITHVQSVDDARAQLTNLAEEDHGLIALIVAPAIATLRGASIDEMASQYVTEFYTPIYKEPRFKGSRVFFLIADHRSDSAVDSFYDHLAVPDEMRAERKHSLMKEVNNRITQCILRARGAPLTTEQRKSAGEIIYELLSNTERWAQLDVFERPLEPRARGMLINVHTDPALFLKSAADSPPMKRYLDQILPSLGRRPTFLEVSIFDSGIGLAQRKLGSLIPDSMPASAERGLVIDCLIEHGTSSADETEGIGLYHALKLLTARRGFMRYRGGRLSLFRDFAEQPYLPEKFHSRAAILAQRSTRLDTKLRKKLAYLLDWSSGEFEPTVMARVEGALFTFVLPLNPLPEPPKQLGLALGEAG